jgi:hypothetical protein
MAARPAQLLDARALERGKRRFREIFPRGFRDPTYVDWERDYKQEARDLWRRTLGRRELERLIAAGEFDEIARRVLRAYHEPGLNLLALYEQMALRDALRDPRGARDFAPALLHYLHGGGDFGGRLERFTEELDRLPQRQSRIAKWPVVTLFPFLADPSRHLILKPNLTKEAARRHGFDLRYRSRPNGDTYAAFLDFAGALDAALASWRPRDRIDTQGFIWVTCSEEYESWPWE